MTSFGELTSVLRATAAVAVAVALLLAAGPANAQQPTPPASAQGAEGNDEKIFDDLKSLLAPADLGQTFPAIVLLSDHLAADSVKRLQRSVGPFDMRFSYPSVAGFAATLTKAQVLALSRLDEVAHIEWDRPVRPALDQATAWFGVGKARSDFDLDGNADGLGTYSTGDIVVAVLDTGIDTGHVDLDGGKVLAWQDFVNGQPSPYDEGEECDYHGTHVSSIVAGEGQGNPAFAGVAPAAALVGIKVMGMQPLPGGGEACMGSTSQIAAGIQWVIDNKDTYNIRVLNMSLVSDTCSTGNDAMSQLTNDAVDAGLVAAVAAGNSGPASCTIGSPGAAEDAITVGAMADPAHGSALSATCGPLPVGGFYLACFSSRGPTADGRTKPDVVGPGVNIMAASGGTTNGYKNISGTSMSSPFVAGVAALMLHADPALTPADVKSIITGTAVDWGPAGKDFDYGAGRLDAYEAIRVAANASGTNIDLPEHHFVSQELAGAGDSDHFTIEVTDPAQPLAIALVMPTWSSLLDFDMELLDKDGSQVDPSETTTRQETIGIASAPDGPYTLRVYAYSGSEGGPYFFDMSAGGSIDALADSELEVGRVMLDDAWKTVSLTKTFSNPVVVARPPSSNGSGPTTLRIRNVTGNSFQIRLQEWDYLDGIHVNEEVDYVVMEAGSYVLTNGDRVEAGKLNTSATTSSVTRSLGTSFPTPPAIITSIMTFNGSDAVTTRVHNVAASSFQVRMQEQEAQDNVHKVETIGYIAWKPGSGTVDDSTDYEAGFKDGVTDTFSSITFGNAYASPPCLLADMNTTNGGNTASLRWKNKSTSAIKVQVDEEQSLDAETGHVSEKVAYFAFACPIWLETGKLTLDDAWKTVSLTKTFSNPVVVARPPSSNGSGPTTVRIRNVTGNSFQIRLQEWDYQDGTHVYEEVDYVVMEAGSYVLTNGDRVEAGKLNTSATTTSVTRSLDTSFPAPPAVVTSTMTFNGSDAVTTRVQNVAASSFQVRMQEQEAQDNVHKVETIGYIAWQPGTGTVDDPMAYEVGTKTGVDHTFSSISFSNTYPTPPCFLADMNTMNGGNTASLRWKNKSTSAIKVQVDEEQSLDAETGHVSEKVAYFAFACPP